MVKFSSSSRLSRCTGLVRRFFATRFRLDDAGHAAETEISKLKAWEQTHYLLPPVKFSSCEPAPTVLQWLRRRGPSLPNAVIQELCRKKWVRVHWVEDGQEKLRRHPGNRLLPLGARVLIPKSVVTDSQHAKPRSTGALGGRTHVRLASELRQRVLYRDADVLVLDKPAGLAVQGGTGIALSLDAALPALAAGPAESPRLVHRLDREVAGALVVACHEDAASWLSAAFRYAATRLVQDSDARQGNPHPGLGVDKTYWALVKAPLKALPDEGTICTKLHGTMAVTHFRVCRRHCEGPVWLELRPVTGKKHQLRQHCALSLAAPILGERRYRAELGDDDSKEDSPRSAQDPAAGRLQSTRTMLQLFCRRVIIRKGGGRCIDVTAPVPVHMSKEFTRLGWAKNLQ